MVRLIPEPTLSPGSMPQLRRTAIKRNLTLYDTIFKFMVSSAHHSADARIGHLKIRATQTSLFRAQQAPLRIAALCCTTGR